MASDTAGEGLMQALEAFNMSPEGGTPLCAHITDVLSAIRKFEDQLRAKAQKAVLVICTDGEASDGNLAQALAPLKELPVHMVVRLSTDDENITQYWSRIDENLELDIDVLDDLTAEATMFNELNPWLTYGEPLQRLRLFGTKRFEFGLADEVALNHDQMRIVCNAM